MKFLKILILAVQNKGSEPAQWHYLLISLYQIMWTPTKQQKKKRKKFFLIVVYSVSGFGQRWNFPRIWSPRGLLTLPCTFPLIQSFPHHTKPRASLALLTAPLQFVPVGAAGSPSTHTRVRKVSYSPQSSKQRGGHALLQGWPGIKVYLLWKPSIYALVWSLPTFHLTLPIC